MMVDKMKDIRYQLDVRDKNFVDLRHQPKSFTDECDETIDILKSLDDAIEIGERIINDDYVVYTDDLDKWFEKSDISDIIHRQMPKSLRDELDTCYEIANNKKNKDIEDFFNLIKNNFENWWS